VAVLRIAYTLFNSNMWILHISLIFHECFADVKGKHMRQVDDKDNIVKSNYFLRTKSNQ